jgi:hypothetical protein
MFTSSESQSLKGSSSAVMDGFAFFADDISDVLVNIGDIWGQEESLEWEMSLDSDIFGDPNTAVGLPVSRPEVRSSNEMTISTLARAVKEESARIASLVPPRVEEPHSRAPKFKKSVPEAVWSFAEFEKSSVSPPRRKEKASGDKDLGLLDILQDKTGKAPAAAPKAPTGSMAPRFAESIAVPERKSPVKKKATLPKKKKSIPVGSLTEGLFDFSNMSGYTSVVESSDLTSSFLKEIYEPVSSSVDTVGVADRNLTSLSDVVPIVTDSLDETPALFENNVSSPPPSLDIVNENLISDDLPNKHQDIIIDREKENITVSCVEEEAKVKETPINTDITTDKEYITQLPSTIVEKGAEGKSVDTVSHSMTEASEVKTPNASIEVNTANIVKSTDSIVVETSDKVSIGNSKPLDNLGGVKDTTEISGEIENTIVSDERIEHGLNESILVEEPKPVNTQKTIIPDDRKNPNNLKHNIPLNRRLKEKLVEHEFEDDLDDVCDKAIDSPGEISQHLINPSQSIISNEREKSIKDADKMMKHFSSSGWEDA